MHEEIDTAECYPTPVRASAATRDDDGAILLTPVRRAPRRTPSARWAPIVVTSAAAVGATYLFIAIASNLLNQP